MYTLSPSLKSRSLNLGCTHSHPHPPMPAGTPHASRQPMAPLHTSLIRCASAHLQGLLRQVDILNGEQALAKCRHCAVAHNCSARHREHVRHEGQGTCGEQHHVRVVVSAKALDLWTWAGSTHAHYRRGQMRNGHASTEAKTPAVKKGTMDAADCLNTAYEDHYSAQAAYGHAHADSCACRFWQVGAQAQWDLSTALFNTRESWQAGQINGQARQHTTKTPRRWVDLIQWRRPGSSTKDTHPPRWARSSQSGRRRGCLRRRWTAPRTAPSGLPAVPIRHQLDAGW